MPEVLSPPTNELASTFGVHLATVEKRTADALALSGFSGLLVHSGALLDIFQDDRTYPFQANAPFKVWAPVDDAPDSFVWFAPGARPRLVLHQPRDYWYKSAQTPSGYWVEHFDIRPVPDRAAARGQLPKDLSGAAYIGESFAELSAWGVKAQNPAALMRRLDYARAAKTPYELICLREASRLAVAGHRAAAHAFKAGASEFEIELAFLEACGMREQELPYNPIIALNEGGAVLHYQLLAKRPPAEVYSLLIDAGVQSGGYASDITRTYSLEDADFAALIERMDRMQQALCAGIRAGVDWRDVQLKAHVLTAGVLREADIILCGVEEAVATGVTRVFLPHGIGHLLGLEVHDVGGFLRSPEGGDIPRPDGHPYLRLTRVLEEGFVVTMEPGIYFIDQLLDEARSDARAAHINWSRVGALSKFGGVRIEDDLAVTRAGCENLTRDAFAGAP
jgi:Xaa-Pro dipeptidase